MEVESNFPHKLLLTNTHSKIPKGFANGSSANIEFSNTQLSKMIQAGGFIFGPPNIFDSGVSDIVNAPFQGFSSLVNPISKETKNMGSKKINNESIVDAGLNLIGKKIKKGI